MNKDLNTNILKESEDYYITPEGYKCFTANYHLKRGYCCTNGCKHCPYKKPPNPLRRGNQNRK